MNRPIEPEPSNSPGPTVPRSGRQRRVPPSVPPTRAAAPIAPATARDSKIAQSGAISHAAIVPPRQPVSSAPASAGQMPNLSRYEVGGEIGRGGMGMVREARDPALQQALAIKLLLDTNDAESRQSFVEEAQITGQLEHPNIIPVHELGTDDFGRSYLAMKRIDGRTLHAMIAESAQRRETWAASERRMLDIFLRVADAIAYAHSRGVIHRDLKPENVMIGSFGEVLVMDWGLAKPLEAAPEAALHRPDAVSSVRRSQGQVTMQGDIFGSPAYMPTEQARGDVAAIDRRADIFALGAMLYQMLTLEPPYTGDSVDAVLAMAAEARIVPPRTRAIEQRPGYLLAWVGRGKAHVDAGNLDAGIADLTRAISIDGTDHDAIFSRSLAYGRANRYAEAMADLDAAVKLDPSDAEYRYFRGYLNLVLGQNGEALADFDAALALDAEHWLSQANRAVALVRLGRRDEARQAYARALEICPRENRQQIRDSRRQLLGE